MNWKQNIYVPHVKVTWESKVTGNTYMINTRKGFAQFEAFERGVPHVSLPWNTYFPITYCYGKTVEEYKQEAEEIEDKYIKKLRIKKP